MKPKKEIEINEYEDYYSGRIFFDGVGTQIFKDKKDRKVVTSVLGGFGVTISQDNSVEEVAYWTEEGRIHFTKEMMDRIIQISNDFGGVQKMIEELEELADIRLR